MVNAIQGFQRAESPKAVNSCKLAYSRLSPENLRRALASAFLATGLVVISACSTPGPNSLAPGQSHNCLLPGQMTRIGGQPFLSARRAVTADRASCKAQGGEPLATSDQQASADPQ